VIETSLLAHGGSVSPRETLRTWGEQTQWRSANATQSQNAIAKISGIYITPLFAANGGIVLGVGASGSLDKTVKVWDAQTGQEKLTLKGHSGSVSSVSVSRDGKRPACARDGSLEMWDVHSLTKSK